MFSIIFNILSCGGLLNSMIMNLIKLFILLLPLLFVSCASNENSKTYIRSVILFNSSASDTSEPVTIWYSEKAMVIGGYRTQHYCNGYSVNLKPKEFHKVSIQLEDGQSCAYPVTEDVTNSEKIILRKRAKENANNKVLLLIEARYEP